MRPTPLHFFAQLVGKSAAQEVLITGAAIDSRLVQPNDLFFALKGKKVDGHDFLAEVAAKGAKAAVVEEGFIPQDPNLPLKYLYVPNVVTALQEMGKKIGDSLRAKVLGITGSVGKTTTKGFLQQLLQEKYRVAATPLSYNTDITLPLFLLNLNGDEEILLLEMGIGQPGDMDKLIEIISPDVALLTNIALQHASGFPDGLEGIAREKKKIFKNPRTYLKVAPPEAEVVEAVTFSTHSSADYFLEFITDTEIKITTPENEVLRIPFYLPVKAYAHNLLGALVVARNFGVSWDHLKEKIPHLTLPPMRFEKVMQGGILFINDAYNANPDSMKAALQHLPVVTAGGRKIAVLSEMNALGKYAEHSHRDIAEFALRHVDILFSLGTLAENMTQVWQKAHKEAYHFQSKEELLATLKKIVRPGDVVLIKGARAHSLETLLPHFR